MSIQFNQEAAKTNLLNELTRLHNWWKGTCNSHDDMHYYHETAAYQAAYEALTDYGQYLDTADVSVSWYHVRQLIK